MKNSESLKRLLKDVRSCRICERHLPGIPRPILAAETSAKILIIGQAPGKKVHESGVAWNDASGEKLRAWLGVDRDVFYDEKRIALMPMGFCYPGQGPSGDLPPRKECAPQWHEPILNHLKNVELTILIGQYSQEYYLKNKKKTLTQTVRAWREYLPKYLPLPHPSPRNFIWMGKNLWFETEVVEYLQKRVKKILK